MTEIRMFKTAAHIGRCFEHLDFGFVSDFVLRISIFPG